jgi:acetoin utilization deacetylase AcuC-like enzyme
VLVSAGYDAHERDPLGGMRVTTAGYESMARLLKEAALRHAAGRTAWVTEGGYHLEALRAGLEATIGVLS